MTNKDKIFAVVFVALGLSACTELTAIKNTVSTDISKATTAANNDLARLANNDIPTACGIVTVAETYFNNVASLVPKTAASAEKKAAAIVANICANPPANVQVALADMYDAWTIIQASTTVPSAP